MDGVKNYTVLVIEADMALQHVEKALLERKENWHFDAQFCDCAEKAEELLADDGFDAIVYDLSKRQKDGIAYIERLRKIAPSTPIITLVNSEGALSELSLQHGAVDWLTHDCLLQGMLFCRTLIAAIEQAQLKEDLQGNNPYCASTGVLRKDYFLRRLAESICLAERYSDELSLGVCEIVDYDSIVARFGDDVGTHLASRVAEMLKRNLWGIDLVSWLGEGRFAMLFPREPFDKVENVLEEISATKMTLIGANEEIFDVHLDVGLSRYEPSITTVNEFLCASEEELQISKVKRLG